MTANFAMPAENQDAEAAPATQFNIVGRLRSLPAVVTLWGVATESYARAKGSYVVAKKTLQLVECGAGLVARGSRPIVVKFGPQLSYVDGLACRGLDKLEEVYPDVVKKQPGEILRDACIYGRKKCIDAKDYGVGKVSDVKALSASALHCAAHPLETASVCTAEALRYAQKLLEAADAALDKHMSASGIKAPQGPSSGVADAVALLTLLDTIALKFRLCVAARIMSPVTDLRQRGRDVVTRIRNFLTSPVESADSVNLRHVYLSLRVTYVAVFLDRPFFLLRDLFIYIRLSDLLALVQDYLAGLLPAAEDRELVPKRPIVDHKRRLSSSDDSSMSPCCSDDTPSDDDS